jgi:hypothetical protein
VSALRLYALLATPTSTEAPPSLPPELAARLRLRTSSGLTVAYDEAPASLPRDAASLRAHDQVVRRLAAAWPAVLPFRFGQSAADELALLRALERRAEALHRRLEQVRGCLQWTVRAWGKPAAQGPGRDQGPGGDQVPHQGPGPGAAGGPGTRYLQLRRPALDPPALRALRERLSPLARGEIVAPGRPPLLASLYYLVRDSDHRDWKRGVAEALARCPELRCTSTGPWPPYAFAAEFP